MYILVHIYIYIFIYIYLFIYLYSYQGDVKFTLMSSSDDLGMNQAPLHMNVNL